jgi:hypothetical protein
VAAPKAGSKRRSRKSGNEKRFPLLWCFWASLLPGCASYQERPAVVEPWYPRVNENGDPLFAVYENRIPCADCERTKLALALYRHRGTNMPSTYLIARVYVGKDDDRTINQGTWNVAHGTKLDSNATVYQLDDNAPQEFRSYWVIGENLLFILDRNLNPKIGDGHHSYTLNKTAPQS